MWSSTRCKLIMEHRRQARKRRYKFRFGNLKDNKVKVKIHTDEDADAGVYGPNDFVVTGTMKINTTRNKIVSPESLFKPTWLVCFVQYHHREVRALWQLNLGFQLWHSLWIKINRWLHLLFDSFWQCSTFPRCTFYRHVRRNLTSTLMYACQCQMLPSSHWVCIWAAVSVQWRWRMASPYPSGSSVKRRSDMVLAIQSSEDTAVISKMPALIWGSSFKFNSEKQKK